MSELPTFAVEYGYRCFRQLSKRGLAKSKQGNKRQPCGVASKALRSTVDRTAARVRTILVLDHDQRSGSTFNVQHSMFNVQCSMFNVQCSTFNVQRSTFHCFTTTSALFSHLLCSQTRASARLFQSSRRRVWYLEDVPLQQTRPTCSASSLLIERVDAFRIQRRT
jgi:hypothetical protein